MKRALPGTLAVTATLLLAGCASASAPAAIGPPPGSTPASASASPAWPARWILPDQKLTPGAVQPGVTLADLCPHVSPRLEALRPGSAEKRRIYAEYGITHHAPGQYEIDHLVPIELGGNPASQANLWPEPNDRPDPAMERKYHLDPAYVHNSKDVAEDVIKEKVCAGQVPLAEAQHAVATDWREAYVRWVGKPPAS